MIPEELHCILQEPSELFHRRPYTLIEGFSDIKCRFHGVLKHQLLLKTGHSLTAGQQTGSLLENLQNNVPAEIKTTVEGQHVRGGSYYLTNGEDKEYTGLEHSQQMLEVEYGEKSCEHQQ